MLWESVLSFHHMGPGRKHLHLLNLLTGLRICISAPPHFTLEIEPRHLHMPDKSSAT